MGAIVRVDTRHFRRIAQENWGLTKQQMVGMHVHHRIPRSEGGTNDPANLYVCSAWFHAYVWHDESYFTLNASKGGKSPKARAGQIKGGKTSAPPQTIEAVRKTGLANRGKKYPRNGSSQNGAPITNAQKWQCTVTGKVSSPGALSNWQKARGIDTKNRVKLNAETMA